MCVDMNISPIQSTSDDNIPIEDLAGNKHLTQQQKIHEASRQFEKIMLQQILSEMQKPVIKSEFSDDDSTASDIYQGYISNALAEGMSKSGSFGFAKIFEQQLSPHPAKSHSEVPAQSSENTPTHNHTPALTKSP
jgi:Rod binding domain-containing protein